MTIRVLVVDDQSMVRAGFRMLLAGASGFVLKDDSPEQLIAAIRTVADGDALLSPTVTRRVIQRFARMSRPAPPKQLDELSDRERDVFRLMSRGLSNAEIGNELYIGETTVKTHVTHILQKLDPRDRVQAVVLAHQTGLFE
jgi:DNA-binding NarL/FixJ family response regulator